GEENFYLKVVTFPHLVLRENKMIATAGADRLQEGMRKAFGKPIGLAARVEIGSVILELSVKAENLDKAKEGMKAASTKLPMRTKTLVVQLEKPVAQ
ncbi:MAG: 50S ribosomal protein L16, partial [Nitrososphaerales archaeon]|nr:50S ribosomal protein L16 [Nitrososphaerales archaeon]